MAGESQFNQETRDQVCDYIASGLSLRQIAELPNMPKPSLVCKWLTQEPEFVEQYARAREQQAELLANEIVSIADEQPDCEPSLYNAAIQRNRLRVDARKWIACKLKPKVYGDRISQEHSGPEGGPIKAEIKVEFVKPA